MRPTYLCRGLVLEALAHTQALCTQVPGTDQSERIFVGGLPYYLNEEQCRAQVSSFGPLKTFDLVKDKETGNSKG